MNTDPLPSKIDTFEKRTLDQISQIKSYLANMEEKLKEVDQEHLEIKAKLQRTKEQATSLESSITKLRAEISDLETKIQNQENVNMQQEENIGKLRSTSEDLKVKEDQTKGKIELLKSQISDLENQIKQKQEAKESLLSNLDAKVESIKKQLDEAKAKLASIDETYSAMNYLMNSGLLETPEVEILSIVAAQRPVSNDAIKDQVKSVSPVLVSRTITKLEADGMIVNKDGLWDLSDNLLSKLSAVSQ